MKKIVGAYVQVAQSSRFFPFTAGNRKVMFKSQDDKFWQVSNDILAQLFSTNTFCPNISSLITLKVLV